jgi:hypothetical protein
VLQLPRCALRVTQPRQPGFKFNAAMGFAGVGRGGWVLLRCSGPN